MRQLIVGTGSISTGGTYYTGLTGRDDWTTSDDQCRIPVPVTGTLRKLRLKVTTAAGSGNNHAFALLINGSASALAVTISDTATEGSNVATDVSVTAGDYVALRRVNTTFNAAGLVRWSLEFEGATGESWYGVWSAGQLAGGGPFYHPPFVAYGSTSASANRSLVAIAGAVTRYDVRVRVAPGVGTSHDIVLSKNGVTQNGSGGTPDTRLSISNTAITGSASGFSLTVAPGDLLQYVCTQTGAAATTHLSIGTKLVADVDGYAQLSPFSPSNEIPNGATNWTTLALETWTTTEAAASQTLDAAYWATALYASAAPPGASKSYALSLRKNGASPAEALTLTISGASSPTTASDTAHTLAFANSDTIALQSVPAGTPARVELFLALALRDMAPPTAGMLVHPGMDGGMHQRLAMTGGMNG